MNKITDIIKAVLDRDCYKSINGQCRQGFIYTGTVDGPGKLKTFCWLCHKNDDLAQEIANAIELTSVNSIK